MGGTCHEKKGVKVIQEAKEEKEQTKNEQIHTNCMVTFHIVAGEISRMVI